MLKKNSDPEKPIIFLDPRPPFENNDEKAERSDNSVIKEILDWAKHIAVAVAIGLLLVFFVVQRNEVIGSSMVPNLNEDDQLLVQKISRLFSGGIGYEDIITINADGLYNRPLSEKNIIKRVIGIPGDKIDIEGGEVYRNGIKLEEKYLDSVTTDERNEKYSHVVLDEDEFFVLGDNRPVSLDSRTFGPITRDRIIGEVLFRILPLDSFGKP